MYQFTKFMKDLLFLCVLPAFFGYLVAHTFFSPKPQIDYVKTIEACNGKQDCVDYWVKRAERNGHPIEPTTTKGK